MNSIEELIESIQGKLDRISLIHGRYCAVIIANPDGEPIELIGRRGRYQDQSIDAELPAIH